MNVATRISAARSASRSHVGKVRAINEDRVFDWPEGGVWAVADGMGGHQGGDLAAQTVVDSLRGLTAAEAPPSAASVLAALQDANARIFARNRAAGERAGATVVVLSRHGDAMQLAWAGDSRCYRIRAGAVTQLTHDHSVVQELVDAGVLDAAAAAEHPQANVVTRALGVDEVCAIETCGAEARAGDRYLLCSDGLSRSLALADLAEGQPEALVDLLLGNALRRDGSDNISLVALELD